MNVGLIVYTFSQDIVLYALILSFIVKYIFKKSIFNKIYIGYLKKKTAILIVKHKILIDGNRNIVF